MGHLPTWVDLASGKEDMSEAGVGIQKIASEQSQVLPLFCKYEVRAVYEQTQRLQVDEQTDGSALG